MEILTGTAPGLHSVVGSPKFRWEFTGNDWAMLEILSLHISSKKITRANYPFNKPWCLLPTKLKKFNFLIIFLLF